MRALGIDFISLFGVPPAEALAVAAQLGCQHVSMGLAPMPANPLGLPLWSLRDDSAMRRELVAAQRDLGVTISLGEVFLIWPGKDIRDEAADFALMREIGAPAVNVLILDPDWQRCVEQLGRAAELAEANGMLATLEFMPGMRIGTLGAAVDAIRATGKTNLRLLLDAMHVFRSGASSAEVAALDPALIGHVQLCDVPLTSPLDYGDEARFYRLPPGEGELPLRAFIEALPEAVSLGLEVPMLAEAKAGMGPVERMGLCVAAARAML